MSGYYGYSMSNNAMAAYEAGLKPVSKWTRAELLEACGDKSELVKPLTVAELRAVLLYRAEWHHTSSHYNRTDFYAFDADALEELTAEKVAAIIAERAPRAPRAPKADTAEHAAEIVYTIWTGNYRKWRRPHDITEIVHIKRDAKMVETSNGNKRVSSLKSLKWLD